MHTIPIIPFTAIQMFANDTVARLLRTAYDPDCSLTFRASIAFAVVRKASELLLLIDSVDYGNKAYEMIQEVHLPNPSLDIDDILSNIEKAFSEGIEELPKRTEKPRQSTPISPYNEERKAAYQVVSPAIDNAWFVSRIVHYIENNESGGDVTFLLDTGLQYLAYLYAAMLILNETFEPGITREMVSMELDDCLNSMSLAGHFPSSETPS